MTSYREYKRQMAIMDADDTDIESWITVRGNHIPIKKGQSKEEAVKSFIENKNDKELAGRSNKPQTIGEATKKVVAQAKENKAIREESKKSESKYDPEFEVVRKNALANSNVYGGRYTQKSKAEAYKEYKNDTASKENTKEDVEKHLADLDKSKKNNPDVKTSGSGAQKSEKPKDIMEWSFNDVMQLPVSDPRVHKYIAKNNGLKESTVSTIAEGFGSTEDLYFEIDRISDQKGYGWDKTKREKPDNKVYRDKKNSNVKYVDPKAWNSPANDPWHALYDSADTKKRWSADWKKKKK